MYSILLIALLTPTMVSAQQYLVDLPGLSAGGGGGLAQLVNSLYYISIALAGMLAVLKIVFAGAKYMLSDVVTSKEDAKKDIRGALFGLTVILSAALVLATINPELSNLNISLTELDQIERNGVVPNNLQDNTSVTPITCAGDSCEDEIKLCEEQLGYITYQQSSPTTILCYTAPTIAAGAGGFDPTGAGIGGITVSQELIRPGESTRDTFDRVVAEVGLPVVRRGAFVELDPTTQRSIEQNCLDLGGNQVVYITSTDNSRGYGVCF